MGGDYVTFPFFATARVTPGMGMWTQPPDWPNTQQIKPDPTGAITYAYFGCWLDIDQSADQFPLAPPSAGSPDGPFTAAQPISQSAIRNQHQCIVAEISFDSIPIFATPGETDKLAQRNLVVNGGTKQLTSARRPRRKGNRPPCASRPRSSVGRPLPACPSIPCRTN
jgi:hypothetical protein